VHESKGSISGLVGKSIYLAGGAAPEKG